MKAALALRRILFATVFVSVTYATANLSLISPAVAGVEACPACVGSDCPANVQVFPVEEFESSFCYEFDQIPPSHCASVNCILGEYTTAAGTFHCFVRNCGTPHNTSTTVCGSPTTLASP